VGRVQTGDRAIIFDADEEPAALGVGQADHGVEQLGVVEGAAVTFEFDGQAFALGEEFMNHGSSPVPSDETLASGRCVR
jgi:hypothetical protein